MDSKRLSISRGAKRARYETCTEAVSFESFPAHKNMNDSIEKPFEYDKEKFEALRARKLAIFNRAGEKNEEFFEETMNRGRKLLEKYPNAREYAAFHVLIGSSEPSGILYEDFEGDDSVEKYLGELEEKYPG